MKGDAVDVALSTQQSMLSATAAAITAIPPDCTGLASHDDETWHVAWVAAGSSEYTANPEAISPDGELRVLYRDASIVVVEKPAFFPTENTRTIKDSVRARVEALLRGHAGQK